MDIPILRWMQFSLSSFVNSEGKGWPNALLASFYKLKNLFSRSAINRRRSARKSR